MRTLTVAVLLVLASRVPALKHGSVAQNSGIAAGDGDDSNVQWDNSEEEVDRWRKMAFVSQGGVIPDSLVSNGKYSGNGQCSMDLLSSMESECQKNVTAGNLCQRTQFIQAHSDHWLHDRMAEQKDVSSESDRLWKINTSYNVDGARVTMLSPHGVYLIEGFLKGQEANEMVESYNEGIHLKKPGVGCPVLRHDCYNTELLTYPGNHCELRHATSKFFKDHDRGVAVMKRKIELLTRVPSRFGENLQMSKYEPGDFFSAHYDDDACHGQLSGVTEDCRTEARRMITVLSFLTDHAKGSGGATYFPDLDIRVQPRKGDAVLFMPVYVDGTLNPHMMHAGEDARDTKYIAQQWLTVEAAWNQADE